MRFVLPALVVLFFPALALADLREGLVLYHGFDHQTAMGATTMIMRDNHNGTTGLTQGTTVADTVGKFVGCVRTDATGEYMNVPQPATATLDKIGSLSCWVRYEASIGGSTARTIFCTSLFRDSTSLLVQLDATFKPQVIANGTGVTSASAFSANTWYHVAVTWNQAAVELFVNGVSVASGNVGSWTDSSTNVDVGGTLTAQTQFGGRVDEFGYWDRVITADEVTLLAGVDFIYSRFYETGKLNVEKVEWLLVVIAMATSFAAGTQSYRVWLYVKNHKEPW